MKHQRSHPLVTTVTSPLCKSFTATSLCGFLLEKFSRRDCNGFDVTIGAGLAVNEDFKLSAQWICQLHRPQSSSASRFTAAQAGFFILSQSGERPER